MLTQASRQRGFNLIELMVVIAILGMLLAAGLPIVAEAIRDSRVRSAAESMVTGLRVAQSEALKRNTVFRFQLVTSLTNGCAINVNGPAWIASRENTTGLCHVSDYETAPFPIRRDGTLSTGDVTVTADGNGTVCFSGIGRPTSAPAGCNAALAEMIDIKPASGACLADGGDARCLRVLVSASGTIRMCDPAVTSAQDPRIC